MSLTQEAIDGLPARLNAYTKPINYTHRTGGLRLTIHPDGRKVYSVVVVDRGRRAEVEIGPHRAVLRDLRDARSMERSRIDLNSYHTLAVALILADLCKRLYWRSVDIYAACHGDSERADGFAQEVIGRATEYHATRQSMNRRPTEAQRRQYRKDLDATATAARKLAALLARTGIRCNFPMSDGATIGYPEILDFLGEQVTAERSALAANKATGNPRHDIAVLSVEMRNAATLYGIPHDAVAPLVHAVVDDASDKTVTKRRK